MWCRKWVFALYRRQPGDMEETQVWGLERALFEIWFRHSHATSFELPSNIQLSDSWELEIRMCSHARLIVRGSGRGSCHHRGYWSFSLAKSVCGELRIPHYCTWLHRWRKSEMPWRTKWEPSFAARLLPTPITYEMSSGSKNRNWNTSLSRWGPVVKRRLPFNLLFPFTL